MHPVRYNALVARLETMAADHPRTLRRRVVALIVLGYAYVIAVLLALLAGIVLVTLAIYYAHAGAAVKLLIGLVVVTWLVIRSLWVRAVAPAGDRIAPGSAPLLERRVEEIRAALDAPHVHTVLLTDDFNASVTQVPRLGIFGWPRTYLSLGMPLMFGLDPRQLDAVLAHEFAHLSGGHPKLGLWVYRTSRTWNLLLERLGERPVSRILFQAFFHWYVPRLRAYGFVLSRRDEFEADAEAASVCGALAMGDALVALELRHRVLADHAWQEVWNRAHEDPLPPNDAWSRVTARLRQDPEPAVRAEWLGQALRRRALDDDTHPALGDRLQALGLLAPGADAGALAQRLGSASATSAEHYLGAAAAAELLASLDQRWHEMVRDDWSARHEDTHALSARVGELRQLDGEDQRLDPEQLWEMTDAVLRLEGDEAALPLLQRIAAAQPDLAPAHFLLGRALMAQGDAERGALALRRAMSLDADLQRPGLEMLRQHYASIGDRRAHESVQVEQHASRELRKGVVRERISVIAKDTLGPADLTAEEHARVSAIVAGRADVRSVTLARKVTVLRPERPMRIALVRATRPWWRTSRKADQRFAQSMLTGLAPALHGDLLVLVQRPTSWWLTKKLERLPGVQRFAA